MQKKNKFYSNSVKYILPTLTPTPAYSHLLEEKYKADSFVLVLDLLIHRSISFGHSVNAQ